LVQLLPVSGDHGAMLRELMLLRRLLNFIGVKDRGVGGNCPPQNFGKAWKFGQTLGKIKKIRADLSENMLKSGYFITILRKNSVKFSTAPQKTSAPFSYAKFKKKLSNKITYKTNRSKVINFITSNHSRQEFPLIKLWSNLCI
jgi:hypothetical protein